MCVTIKLHISTHPKFNNVRKMFEDNPKLKIADVSRAFNISRLTLAGWVADIREDAGAIIHRGVNKKAKKVRADHVRVCLKCKHTFEVKENYYRCKSCRG